MTLVDTTRPLVSILIPVFNGERYISETLNSALGQTWPSKEVIVVDDGSADNSLRIAKSYESQGVKVIVQPNRGPSSARNTALSRSRGEFIQYLDADDLISKDKIEIQANKLLSSPVGRVAACPWGRFHSTVHEAVFVPEAVWCDSTPIDWLVSAWLAGKMMAAHAWLVPREVAEKAGPWDETPCPNDDGEYFTRVLLASTGVAFCKEACVYYRSGLTGSWSGRRSSHALASIYRSFELCATHLLSAEDSPRSRAACAANFQRFAYGTYPDVPDLVRKAEVRAQELGGSDLVPLGGRLFQALSKTVGWKAARRIQRVKHALIAAAQLSAGRT